MATSTKQATPKRRKNPPLTRAQVRRYENVGLAPTLELTDLAFRWVYRNATDFDVSGAISAVELDRTIEGASTLTVTLRDPDGRLMSKLAQHVMPAPRGKAWTIERDEGWDRILAPNQVGLAMEVRLDGARFRLVKASASFASSEVTLTFEDLIVYLLKRKKDPPLKASRSAMTRAMFVQRLVREIHYISPPFVCPDLYVVQPVDKASSSGAGGSVATTNADKAGSAINRRYPAHSIGAAGAARLTKEQVREAAAAGGFRGREITGMEQIAHGESDYYPGVISSDQGHGLWQMTPRVWGAAAIAKMNSLGGLAEMRNPTQNAKMAKFLYDDAGHSFKPWYGTKYLTVAPGPGAGATNTPDTGASSDDTSTSSPAPTRSASYQFERKRGESSWAAIQRLASEVNWRAFVVGEAVYYISEDSLFAARPRYELHPETPGILDLTYDVDWGKPVSGATLTVALARWEAPPGSVVLLRGFGPPDGRWLIGSVRRDWFSPTAEIDLKQPGRQTNEPSSVAATGSYSSGSANSKGDTGGKVDALIDICRKFSGPYVYGGGHGPALSSLSYSQGLDCSSSTSLALFKAGMWDGMSTARTSDMFSNWGKAGRGEQMTIVYGGQHVFIQFHGKGVDRFDTGGGQPPGPRLRHGPAWYHANERHWPGT